MATIELRDIPETAHLWIQRRKVAYRGLTFGEATAGQRRANTTALNGYLSDAAGGVLELPAGAMIEVDGALSVPGSMRIQGNGATLAYKGALDSPPWISPRAAGLTIDIENVTIQGATEAEVTAAGNVTTRAIQCATNTNLTLCNVRYTDWLGSCVVGATGANVVIDGCDLQSWHSHGLGGDSARGWVVRNSTFRRIGSGSSLDHHLYINPDVWLYLENCEFLKPDDDTSEGWGIHYYGSDKGGPYRTPTFRDCYFERKVFTCESALTEFVNCHFVGLGAKVQIQNDATFKGGKFDDSAHLDQRTTLASFVLIDGVTWDGVSTVGCVSSNPDGCHYLIRDCNLINAEILNRHNAANTIEVRGGLWRAGRLDLAIGATAHLDGRLRINNAVTKLIWEGSSYTEGDVIYYD